MSRTACVVSIGPCPGVVGLARSAATRWLLSKLREIDRDLESFVLTPDPKGWTDVEAVRTPAEDFDWGAFLASFMRGLGAERLLYFSAGSGFLLTEEELGGLLGTELPRPFAVLNNFYSTDFALISPPVPDIFRGLRNDNALGWRLWEMGYRCFELPRNARTQFDIDTPGELQILACKGDLPAELADALGPIPRGKAQALLSALVEPGSRVTILGRVSGHLMRFLDRKAACRTRILSESRGLKAEGRRERPLILALYEALGPEKLVAELSREADIVVWDVRVLFSGLGTWPSPAERFSFDLLDEAGVGEPLLRLLRAIKGAEVPFILGGHSLVSGAIYLAVELAWRRVERLKELVHLEEGDEAGLVEVRPR